MSFTTSSGRLKVLDMKSSHSLFRLVPSVRHTAETESGLLPTAQTQGLKINRNGQSWPIPLELLPTPTAVEEEKGTTVFNPTSQMGKGLKAMALNGMLPTPTAIDSGSGRVNRSLSDGAKDRPTLAALVRQISPQTLLLTPGAMDGMRSRMTLDILKAHNKPKSNLSEQIAHKIGGGDSHLSPLFVAEMMGYPLMWTVLPFLSHNGGDNQ